jgi:hypothetical protein
LLNPGVYRLPAKAAEQYHEAMTRMLHPWLAMLMLVLSIATAHAQSSITIPALHATALSGEKVELPAVFRGKAGILVIGFSQGSRDPATAWGKRLYTDFHDSKTVLYYQVSVLAGVPKILRGYVVRKISEGVPDPAKPSFIAIYDHEAELRAAAGYNKPDDAYVLLVDGTGVVRWTTAGLPSDATYAELKRRLEQLPK